MSRWSKRPWLLITGWSLIGFAVSGGLAWTQRWLDRDSIEWIALVLLLGIALVVVPGMDRRRNRMVVATLLLLQVPMGLPWLMRLKTQFHGTEQMVERRRRLLGIQAPDFEATDLEGRRFRLSEHRGEVVVVEVWRTWCAPCIQALPYLEYASGQLAGDGLVVVALSDEPADVQREVRDRLGISFPMLREGMGVPRFYGNTDSFPSTFVIDREGVIRDASLLGGYAGVLQLERLVKGQSTGPRVPPPDAVSTGASPGGSGNALRP